MKILILNWRDIKHPLAGGAEISLLEHAKYWKKKNNDVIWFTSSFPGAKNEEIIDGIHYLRKGSVYTVHLWAFLYYINHRLGNPDRVIDSFHFIPFFTPLYVPFGKIVALINEVAGKIWFDNLPYVFALIGYHSEPFFFKFYKKVPFITGSKSAADEINNLGIPEKKIHIVHHGIKVATVKADIAKEKNPVLVFVGRVSIDKGVKDVIETFINVKKIIKNAELWIIGKEERKGIMDELLKSIKNEKQKKDTKYWGFVSEEKKFEFLKRSWLLVHPSKKEGWGLNVIEAGSQGTPTVGYNVEGLRDSVKNGNTGILVSSENPSLLADAAVRLIEDKKTYAIFSKNAIKWSERFTWDVSVKRSLAIISKAYEKNK